MWYVIVNVPLVNDRVKVTEPGSVVGSLWQCSWMAIGVVPDTVMTLMTAADAGATANASHAATSVPTSASVRLIASGRYPPCEFGDGVLDVVLVVVERGDVVAALEGDALDRSVHLRPQAVTVVGRHDGLVP